MKPMELSRLEVLASAESVLGTIYLQQREVLSEPGTFVTEIAIDHQFLMSSYSATSERALLRRALALHKGDALQVLVGGLGLGCTAHEALASKRVARVEVIELLSPVIGWLEHGLLPLSDELTRDRRFVIRQDDVYARLSRAPGAADRRFDLLLIDVDHSPEERLVAEERSFYAAEGLAWAKLHLAAHGLLGVWSYAESPRFERALRDAFRDVLVDPLTFVNPVIGESETHWLYFARG